MNAFYIFLYYEIFMEFDGIQYLINHPTMNSLKKSFSSFTISKTMKSFQVENIILYTHIIKYVNELHDMESRYGGCKHIGCKQKYAILSTIFRNRFLDEACREKVIDMYCKNQRRYLALCRFAYLWKVKKAYTCVESDLYLNTIEPTKNNTFVLFQNNKKYCFIISDLIKTLEYAVCHEWEDEFDVISKKPCNPYNKQPFQNHDLFNIYFHMRFNMDVVIPSFFHLWFLEQFDLSTFLIKHKRLLRKICIKHHVFNVSNTSILIYKDIRIMLFDNNFTRKWLIHDDFPKETLVDLMRPYLYMFYLIYYDVLEYEEIVLYEATLALELMKCYKCNPLFGRRTIKRRSMGLKMNHGFWRNKNRFDFENKAALEDPALKCATVATHKYVFNTHISNFCSLSY